MSSVVAASRNTATLVGPEGSILPIRIDVTLEIGGREIRAPTGGIDLVDTAVVSGRRLRADAAKHVDDRWNHLVLDAEGWTVQAEWVQGPGSLVALVLDVRPPRTGTHLLRNLELDLSADLKDRSAWRLNAPGNMIRRDVRLAELDAPLGVSPAGGLRGSAALVHLAHDDGTSWTLWPFCRSEIGDITVALRDDDRLAMSISTGLAARLEPGSSLRYEGLLIDVAADDIDAVLDRLPGWYAGLGAASPALKPDWARGASIYETQIGWSVFRGGHTYSPHPTVRALIDDLDRIDDLGFHVIQLMPRQPYPSYNVHDYDDITTSYGDEAELRELVARCHERGMRVILDVLMHGVLDQESIAAAADAVRSGPFAHRLDESGDPFASPLADRTYEHIAWSRHIVDFEPYWRARSEPVSPLAAAHPDWFVRDSAGSIVGAYTKAFESRNAEWRDFFSDAVVALADRLDVDGFRFDAPTYNWFPNWNPPFDRRAGGAPLGCVELFADLRARLKGIDPELLMYTEPSGVLLRASMDLNYNYDEQWLIGAVTGHTSIATGVRHGRDLAVWLRDRDRSLPPGSLTAHHVDSHDTFWWPAWGAKWRRESIGIPPTAALTAVFMLYGGPFMMFAGGEEGIDETIRSCNLAKRAHEALRSGETRLIDTLESSPSVFAVERRAGSEGVVVLVNLSDESCEPVVPHRMEGSATAVDVLASIDTSRPVESRVVRWKLGPWQASVLRFDVSDPAAR